MFELSSMATAEARLYSVDGLSSFWTVIRAGIMELKSTVSSNVSTSLSEVRLRLKSRSTGPVISGEYAATSVAFSSEIGTRRLPFMSSTVNVVKEMYVELVLCASCVKNFI